MSTYSNGFEDCGGGGANYTYLLQKIEQLQSTINGYATAFDTNQLTQTTGSNPTAVVGALTASSATIHGAATAGSAVISDTLKVGGTTGQYLDISSSKMATTLPAEFNNDVVAKKDLTIEGVITLGSLARFSDAICQQYSAINVSSLRGENYWKIANFKNPSGGMGQFADTEFPALVFIEIFKGTEVSKGNAVLSLAVETVVSGTSAQTGALHVLYSRDAAHVTSFSVAIDDAANQFGLLLKFLGTSATYTGVITALNAVPVSPTSPSTLVQGSALTVTSNDPNVGVLQPALITAQLKANSLQATSISTGSLTEGTIITGALNTSKVRTKFLQLEGQVLGKMVVPTGTTRWFTICTNDNFDTSGLVDIPVEGNIHLKDALEFPDTGFPVISADTQIAVEGQINVSDSATPTRYPRIADMWGAIDLYTGNPDVSATDIVVSAVFQASGTSIVTTAPKTINYTYYDDEGWLYGFRVIKAIGRRTYYLQIGITNPSPADAEFYAAGATVFGMPTAISYILPVLWNQMEVLLKPPAQKTGTVFSAISMNSLTLERATISTAEIGDAHIQRAEIDNMNVSNYTFSPITYRVGTETDPYSGQTPIPANTWYKVDTQVQDPDMNLQDTTGIVYFNFYQLDKLKWDPDTQRFDPIGAPDQSVIVNASKDTKTYLNSADNTAAFEDKYAGDYIHLATYTPNPDVPDPQDYYLQLIIIGNAFTVTLTQATVDPPVDKQVTFQAGFHTEAIQADTVTAPLLQATEKVTAPLLQATDSVDTDALTVKQVTVSESLMLTNSAPLLAQNIITSGPIVAPSIQVAGTATVNVANLTTANINTLNLSGTLAINDLHLNTLEVDGAATAQSLAADSVTAQDSITTPNGVVSGKTLDFQQGHIGNAHLDIATIADLNLTGNVDISTLETTDLTVSNSLTSGSSTVRNDNPDDPNRLETAINRIGHLPQEVTTAESIQLLNDSLVMHTRVTDLDTGNLQPQQNFNLEPDSPYMEFEENASSPTSVEVLLALSQNLHRAHDTFDTVGNIHLLMSSTSTAIKDNAGFILQHSASTITHGDGNRSIVFAIPSTDVDQSLDLLLYANRISPNNRLVTVNQVTRMIASSISDSTFLGSYHVFYAANTRAAAIAAVEAAVTVTPPTDTALKVITGEGPWQCLVFGSDDNPSTSGSASLITYLGIPTATTGTIRHLYDTSHDYVVGDQITDENGDVVTVTSVDSAGRVTMCEVTHNYHSATVLPKYIGVEQVSTTSAAGAGFKYDINPGFIWDGGGSQAQGWVLHTNESYAQGSFIYATNLLNMPKGSEGSGLYYSGEAVLVKDSQHSQYWLYKVETAASNPDNIDLNLTANNTLHLRRALIGSQVSYYQDEGVLAATTAQDIGWISGSSTTIYDQVMGRKLMALPLTHTAGYTFGHDIITAIDALTLEPDRPMTYTISVVSVQDWINDWTEFTEEERSRYANRPMFAILSNTGSSNNLVGFIQFTIPTNNAVDTFSVQINLTLELMRWHALLVTYAGPAGVLTVSEGGTGQSSLTQDQALIGNGTDAVTSRAITATPFSESSALFTSGGAYTALAAKQNTLNRTVQTNLASTSAATDTGGNLTPGVTGILGTANGGTGNNAGGITTTVPTAAWSSGPRIYVGTTASVTTKYTGWIYLLYDQA